MSALVGFALSSLLASFANSFALLIAGRVLQAVFGTALLPVARTMIRLVTPAHERGRNFGMQESLIGVGAASGPLVGGLLVELGGWSGVFLVNVPIAALALVLVRGVPIGASSASAADPNRSKPRLRSVLTAGSFAAPFASQAAAVLAQYSLLLTVPIVLDDRGWSSAGVGAGLVLLTVGMVVSGPAGGRLGDRTGRRFPVYIGLAGATIGTGLAMVAIDSTPAVVLIGIAAFGLGFGLALPNLTSSALETAPPELAGATSGVWSMSRYVGSIPASLLFTVVVSDDVAQAQTLLVVALGAMIVALGCASLMGAGHERPE